MEPILGGRIVNPPQPVQVAWNTAEKQRTAADWALQWLWDQPEISTVLSGMSTMQQVVENVASAEKSSISVLNQDELDLVDRVREIYHDLSPIPCTKCNYCLPCPNGVNIPRNFEIYNEAIMYDKTETARVGYNRWFPAEEHADQCVECLECEDKCPQQIPITTWLPKVHSLLFASS
jgi:predicted aldo/keto reductase-like oxidoreductase